MEGEPGALLIRAGMIRETFSLHEAGTEHLLGRIEEMFCSVLMNGHVNVKLGLDGWNAAGGSTHHSEKAERKRTSWGYLDIPMGKTERTARIFSARTLHSSYNSAHKGRRYL